MSAIADTLKRNGVTPVQPTTEGGESGTPPASTETPSTDTPPASLNDEAVLNYIKGKGIGINSMEDLTRLTPGTPAPELTEEQKVAKQQEKRNAAMAFGFTNQIVKPEDFTNFATDSSRPPADIVYNMFKADRISELKDVPENERPTEAELRQQFDEYYHLDMPEDDKRRKISEKQLAGIAKNYINRVYGKVINLEQEYDSHVNAQTNKTNYSNLVNEAVAGIGDKLVFSYKEGNQESTFDFKLKPEHLEKMKELFNGDLSYQAYGGKDKAFMDETIREGLKLNLWGEILTEFAAKVRTDAEFAINKGARGITPDGSGMGINRNENPGGGENKNSKVKSVLNNPANQQFLKKNSTKN